MEKLILASTSPRRREILKKLGIPFEAVAPDCDESFPANLEKRLVPEFLAEKKVASALGKIGRTDSFVLGSDTIVLMEDVIFGKPKDRAEAFSFLKAFSARAHSVVSGIALFDPREKRIERKTVETRVFFAPLSDDEINRYLDAGEWQDAAGGYKIQGKAEIFVQKIDGNYSAVVGLPTSALYDMLKEHGFSF